MSDLEQYFFLSVQEGELEKVKYAIEHGIDPSIDSNRAIILASELGHTEIVEYLLTDNRVDPSDDDNMAIQLASEKGHAEIVRLLLKDKRVNPAASDNFAIRLASEFGHLKVVKELLADDRVDPSAKDNRAIRMANGKGYYDIVKLLLKDRRVKNTYDLKLLSKHIKNIEKKYIRETSMAMRGLKVSHPIDPERQVSLPPYVLAQILSENVAAYDLLNIAESITPILQPTVTRGIEPNYTVEKRKPVMLKLQQKI